LAEKKLWKDYLDRRALTDMANKIGLVHKKFDRAGFVKNIHTTAFLKMELMERVDAIAEGLRPFLPRDFSRAVKILIKAAPSLKSFENWILTAYVSKYGREHFKTSVATLKELTRHGTAEFAIKPFIIDRPDEMLDILKDWAIDDDEHVRRLAAEGSRPRGVWTMHLEQFKEDPRPVLEILERLRADPSLYVRKAVANNLNDITKDNPDLFIRTARRWQKDKNPHTDWIIKHAARTLLKKGRPEIFPLLGFTDKPKIELARFSMSENKIKINNELNFSFEIVSKSTKKQQLAIDYRLHYITSTGKLSPRVFKLSEKSINAGKSITLKLLINGRSRKKVAFELI